MTNTIEIKAAKLEERNRIKMLIYKQIESATQARDEYPNTSWAWQKLMHEIEAHLDLIETINATEGTT